MKRINHKSSVILSLISTLLVSLMIFSYGCAKKEGKEIKIGAVLPLTGEAAQWGIPPQKGAELAIEQINAKGGLNGKKLSITFQDDTCNPQNAVSALQSILTGNSSIKLVMGAVCSSATLAIAPIAEKQGILLISPASTSPKITDAGDFIFRDIPSDALRGKVFAEYLFEKENLRKVGLLYINNDAGIGNKNAFSERFKELGGTIVGEETYDQGSTDVRSQLTKLKSLDLEALMVVSYPADTIIVVRQAKELAPKLSLFFQAEAVEDPSVIKALGKNLDGIKYILPAKAEGEIPSKFASDYKNKFGSAPELFAAEGYDAINLLALGIKQCNGKADANCIKNFLLTVKDYQGASGIITFDRHGDVTKPMAIREIREGKPTTVFTSK